MRNYFQQEDDIRVSQMRFDEFCARQQFPRAKIKSLLIRDNIRFVHAFAVPCWEFEFYRTTGYSHPLQRYEGRAIARKVIQQNLWPSYEKQYGQSVSHSDYKMVYLDGRYQIFSVTVFEKPVFGKISGDLKVIEDQQVGVLAKKLRDLTGRGPKKTRAVFLNSGLLVYLINGLTSKGDKLFAAKSVANAEYVEKIAEHNLRHAFDEIFVINGTTINNVNLIDIENDFTISLIFAEFAKLSSYLNEDKFEKSTKAK